MWGRPFFIVSGDGAAFIGRATGNEVPWPRMGPGRPQRNALIESLRAEYRNEELFDSLGATGSGVPLGHSRHSLCHMRINPV